MNLYTKQKQTHRCRKQTYGYQKGEERLCRLGKIIHLKIAPLFLWANYINHQEKITCSKLERPTYLLWK